MSILKIKRLHPQAQLPARATDGSAGHDLYACIEQPTEILPGQTVKVPTGLAIQLESRKYVALIFARSSMGTKYGVIPANAVGVIGERSVSVCTIIRTSRMWCSRRTESHSCW